MTVPDALKQGRGLLIGKSWVFSDTIVDAATDHHIRDADYFAYCSIFCFGVCKLLYCVLWRRMKAEDNDIFLHLKFVWGRVRTLPYHTFFNIGSTY